jgi:hypothetical protein
VSADATGWVYRHSPFKGATFAVHHAIADSVNDQHGNEFWMSVARLADKARMERRSAGRAVDELLDGGYIECVEADGANLRRLGRPVRYRFLFPEAPVVYETRSVGATGGRTPPGRGVRQEAAPRCDTTPQEVGRDVAQTQEEPKSEPKEREAAAPPAPSRSIPRKTMWPDGWTPGDAEREAADAAGMDAAARRGQWELFKDDALAKGKAFVDWPAAWRTWCRRWVDYTPAAGRRPLGLVTTGDQREYVPPVDAKASMDAALALMSPEARAAYDDDQPVAQ